MVSILTLLPSTLRAQLHGEAALTYLGNDRPSEAQPGWQQDGQGLAHDDAYWFITDTLVIWKLPVAQDLATHVTPVPGTNYRAIVDYHELWPLGYNHFGDPEVCSFNGQDYLFVPVAAYNYVGLPPAPHPVIAVFRASDLSFVTKVEAPSGTSGEAWCAFDPQKRLCLPDIDAASVMRAVRFYTVNADALQTNKLLLTLDAITPLRDEHDSILEFTYLQGGAISPTAGFLYVSAGGVRGWFDDEPPGYGIEAFELSTNSVTHEIFWRRIKRSTNGPIRYVPPTGYSRFPVHGRFDFQFDDLGYPQPAEEPEGLTYWDLGGGGPPSAGQLHVMLVDHGLPGEDQVTIKHYTSSIFVDLAWFTVSSDPIWAGIENGTSAFPFGTIAQANDEATDGADLRIKTGSYPEALTFSKKLYIFADGGPVLIGR